MLNERDRERERKRDRREREKREKKSKFRRREENDVKTRVKRTGEINLESIWSRGDVGLAFDRNPITNSRTIYEPDEKTRPVLL